MTKSIMPDKGRRRVHITPEYIEYWLVHQSQIVTNLPSDAKLVNSWRETATGNYVFCFASSEWEPLDEGEEIPKLDVEWKTWR